jgi:hypothetical protein
VVKVQKCSDRGVENGIRIETQGQNATRYVFEKFFDCPKALGVLVSLHNDSILDLTQVVVPTPRVLSRGLRRNNSDPLRISNLFNFDDVPAVFHDNEAFTTPSTPEKNRNESNQDASRISSASVPLRIAMSAPRRNFSRGSTFTVDTSSSEISRVLHIPEEVVLDDAEAAATSPGLGLDSTNATKRTLTPEELRAEWSKILEERRQLYAESAVQDHELPCSLDDFVGQFISHEAKSSLADYMAQNGDHNIKLSEWKDSELDTGFSQTRTIEYTHPVDAPMAPPTAEARKEQSYSRYGNHGLIMETKTFVSDVPMTDCFYVADLMLVESKSGENGTEKVVVHMLFDIRFVKSTMFKSIIQRTTKSELEKFLTSYSQFLSRNLGEVATAVPSPAVPVPVSAPQPPPASSRWSVLTVLLLTVVLSLQLWILADMKSIRAEIKDVAGVYVLLQAERMKFHEQEQRLKRAELRSIDNDSEL